MNHKKNIKAKELGLFHCGSGCWKKDKERKIA